MILHSFTNRDAGAGAYRTAGFKIVGQVLRNPVVLKGIEEHRNLQTGSFHVR
jgi:hypothetical protein